MSWDIPLDENCPKCNHYLLLKKMKSGDVKKCSNESCDYSQKLEKEKQDVSKEN